ncbi:MAG: DUF4292 domain-containing protein, partial [Muribaculaceae bacterium]|nr:DUF4292 domain-containing protein [Muribaculaceae bacterium]
LLAACHSSRNAASTDASPSSAPTAQPSAKVSPKQQFETLVGSYQPWTDVSMSVKCTLRSPKSMTVSGKATMIRGEELRLSLRMLGFEVGGLYVDRDSVFFYEKLNRTMVVESMAKLTDATGLTLSDIQDILLGQLAYPGTDRTDASFIKKFNVKADGNMIIAQPRSSALPWHYTLASTPSPELISLTISAPPQCESECTFRPAFLTAAGPVSPAADIKAAFGKQSIDASLTWSLETASWNKALTPQRSLPKGYRRIPLQQLIKSLSTNK